LQTEDNKFLAMARVLLGLLVLVWGSHGVLGWFGGSGSRAALDWLIHLLSIPLPLVLLAAVTDLFGGLALVTGLFTRVAALAVAVDALVTLVLWAIGQVLYTDWLIIQGGASGAYYALTLAPALILAVTGAGAFSLDLLLFRRTLLRSARYLVNLPSEVIAGN
jgi:putative oxidoreductase